MATNSATPALVETEGAPVLIPSEPQPDSDQIDVKLKDIQGVRYTGTADTKTLTVQDFASVGVKADKDLSWTPENHHYIDKEDFNAATLTWLVEGPELFRAER